VGDLDTTVRRAFGWNRYPKDVLGDGEERNCGHRNREERAKENRAIVFAGIQHRTRWR
jgi:hypothetical protein